MFCRSLFVLFLLEGFGKCPCLANFISFMASNRLKPNSSISICSSSSFSSIRRVGMVGVVKPSSYKVKLQDVVRPPDIKIVKPVNSSSDIDSLLIQDLAEST
jgi:hypothetical protein